MGSSRMRRAKIGGLLFFFQKRRHNLAATHDFLRYDREKGAVV